MNSLDKKPLVLEQGLVVQLEKSIGELIADLNQEALGKKVDKEEGKGLSDNNFSDDDVGKLLTAWTHATKVDGDVAVLVYNHLTQSYEGTKPYRTLAHQGMKRCILNDKGEVVYYLDEFNSNLKEDGTPADLSGTDGQVMVEIPMFYWSRSVVGVLEKITVSFHPLPGLTLHPAFDLGTHQVSQVYVGAYPATVQTPSGVIPGLNLDNNTTRVDLSVDKLSSLSGGQNFPMVGLDLTEFRTLARNRGEGWQVWSFAVQQALQVLFYTQFGGFNGQSILGDGNVYRSYLNSSDSQADSPHTLNGLSNTLGNTSGGVQGKNPFVSFNGIESFWGTVWQWVDGVLFRDTVPHVCANPANFSSVLTASYTAVAQAINTAPSGGYISKFQSNFPFLLSGGEGGNSSQFVGDGCWWANGVRGGLVSGAANFGLPCGPAALAADSAPAGRGRAVGGRVMFIR